MIDLTSGGGVDVGNMTHLPVSTTDVSYNGMTFIRSGVVVPYDSYPKFPIELVALNGAVWSASPGVLPSSSINWKDAAFSGSRMVAIAMTTNIVAYTDNGNTWVGATMPATRDWSSIAYGNGKFVAVASGSSVAAHSPNGITWSEVVLPATGLWSSVTYAAGKFVAVSATSGMGAYSTDGVSWTSCNTQNPLNNVSYIDGKFWGVGNSGNGSKSSDGITWSSFALGSGTTYQAIAGGNGIIIAVDSNAQGYRKSTDGGVTWVGGTFDVAKTWRDIVYTNGLFVVIAQDGASSASIRTSRDGTAWSVRNAPSAANWRSLTFAYNKFFAIGQNTSQVAVSSDGLIGAEVHTTNLYLRVS